MPAYWPGGVRHRGNVSPTRLRSQGTGESVTRYCRPRWGGDRERPLRLKPGGLSTVAGTQSDWLIIAMKLLLDAVGAERRGQVIRGAFVRSTGALALGGVA